MSAKKKRNRSGQDRAVVPVEEDISETLSPIKSPSRELPRQGNLQGSARKLKDAAADWHNEILKWNSLNSKGMNVINEIANKKLEKIFAMEQSAGEESGSSGGVSGGLMCEELEPLCEAIVALQAAMTKVVKKMESLTAMMRGVQELETFKHRDEQKGDCLFQTWTLNEFVDTSEKLYSMYQKEVDLRRTIVENVAHARDRNLLMFYTSLWLHQPYIEDRADLLLESMLLETGHR